MLRAINRVLLLFRLRLVRTVGVPTGACIEVCKD